MSQPFRLPLLEDIEARDSDTAKDSLTSNVFYDKDDETEYATKRPGITSSITGSGQAKGVFGYGNNIFAFYGNRLYAYGKQFAGNMGLPIGFNGLLVSALQVDTNNFLSVVREKTGFGAVTLNTDGTIWVCGRNDYGVLGKSGALITQYGFVQLGVDNDWVAIFATARTFYAVKRSGDLYYWGQNKGTGVVHYSLPIFLSAGFSTIDHIEPTYNDTGDVFVLGSSGSRTYYVWTTSNVSVYFGTPGAAYATPTLLAPLLTFDNYWTAEDAVVALTVGGVLFSDFANADLTIRNIDTGVSQFLGGGESGCAYIKTDNSLWFMQTFTYPTPPIAEVDAGPWDTGIVNRYSSTPGVFLTSAGIIYQDTDNSISSPSPSLAKLYVMDAPLGNPTVALNSPCFQKSFLVVGGTPTATITPI